MLRLAWAVIMFAFKAGNGEGAALAADGRASCYYCTALVEDATSTRLIGAGQSSFMTLSLAVLFEEVLIHFLF